MCAVNRVQLGDLLDYEQPTRYIVSSTDYDDAYDTPVLTAGQTFILGYTNETEGIYKASKSNPVIIFDDFVTSFYLVDFDFKVKSSALKILKPKKDVNIYYVYYAMLGIRFVPKEHARHWISKYSQFEIAYPSLAKQQEIVSHLDTFTTLISNLESELEMRRKQYEHYRNQLFGDTLELLLDKVDKGEMEVSTLSEVGTFTRGRRFVRTDIMTEGTPCIHYGDMYTYYGVSAKTTPTFLLPEVAAKLRFAQENDVVIVGAGENNEDIGIGVAWLGNEDVAVHDACYIFKHKMNPLYISYYLRTDIYHKQIKKYVSSGKICSISSDGIGKSIIPIPSSKTQQEIVEKLDAFENLIQSLEQEIKLRKQQYEYYREKLLTL